MGLCGSKKKISSYRRGLVVESHVNTFKALDISKGEARQLYNVFASLDDDDSGEVSLMEFLTFFDLERTAFSKRCFTMFDTDKSAQIDFREFVLSTYCFCAYDKQSLTRFAFDLYDLDSSGELSLAELETLVRSVYGAGFETNIYARRILQRMKKEVGGVGSDVIAVTKNEFVAFVGKHPALIFPAFQMQGVLREKILGNRFWERAVKARAKAFTSDDYQDFVDYMTQDKFEELLEADFEPEAYTSPTPNNTKGNEFARLKFADEEARGRRARAGSGTGAGAGAGGGARVPGARGKLTRSTSMKVPDIRMDGVDGPAVGAGVQGLKANNNARLKVAAARAHRATAARNNFRQHKGPGAHRAHGHGRLRKSLSTRNL